MKKERYKREWTRKERRGKGRREGSEMERRMDKEGRGKKE